MFFYLYFIVVVFCLAAAKNEEYKGHKVYNIRLASEDQQNNISLLKNDLIDFWRRPSFEHGVIGKAMVPPSQFNWFDEKLEELGIAKDVYIEDVYEFLTKEESKRSSARNDKNEGPFDINRYHSYNDILAHLKTLQEKHPTAKVELVEYGQTFENKPLVYLRVTSNTEVEKPIVIVEAGINPREWVTIPAALNIVEQILGEQKYLDALEWVVVPVMNPDGYEHTRNGARFWEKSRSLISHMGHICPGANLNRNFNLDWLHFDSSSSPCSHLFGGVSPFSEIETKMVQHLLEKGGSRVKLYISLLNSNGGYISYPWNYERAASGTFRQHLLLAFDMVKTMRKPYNFGVGSVLFDRASGTSSDFARDQGVLYTFNIDIEQSENGVVIDESEIGGIVEDVWKAVAVAADEMIKLYA